MHSRTSSMLLAVALWAVAWVAGGCDGAAPDGDGESDSDGGTDTGGFQKIEAHDLCTAAPGVSTGVWAGTLRGRAKDLGGACGLGGPDAFVRVELSFPADLRVEARGVDFVPRIGLVPTSCVEGRELGCTEGLPLTLGDLPAGAEIYVAVGIDAEDPALASPVPPPGEADPLDFELDVLVRRILGAGEYCLPETRGRCRTGTACLEDATDGGWRCAELEADTCSRAEELEVPAEPGVPIVLELDLAQPQGDAHHHTCAGARMRERVYRLSLPPEMAPTADLVVTSADPSVGLALRSPGCASVDEIACAAPGPDPSVIFPNAGELAGQGVRPFLFVELPDAPPEGEPAEPVSVTLEVVDG